MWRSRGRFETYSYGVRNWGAAQQKETLPFRLGNVGPNDTICWCGIEFVITKAVLVCQEGGGCEVMSIVWTFVFEDYLVALLPLR